MKEKATKKKIAQLWWVWGIAVLVIAGGLGGYFAFLAMPEKSEPAELMTGAALTEPAALVTTEPKSAAVQAESALIESAVNQPIGEVDLLPTFDFTVEEWISTMDALNTQIGMPALNYQDVAHQQTMFTINQSDYVFYMGRLNNSDEIHTVMLGAYSDGSDASGSEILLSMAIFVASLNPEYTSSQSGAVISEMGLLSGNFPADALLIKDGTEYSFVNDPEYGILFFASPSE